MQVLMHIFNRKYTIYLLIVIYNDLDTRSILY